MWEPIRTVTEGANQDVISAAVSTEIGVCYGQIQSCQFFFSTMLALPSELQKHRAKNFPVYPVVVKKHPRSNFLPSFF